MAIDPARQRTPSGYERYLAALIRTRADKTLRRTTPAWIAQLVENGAPPRPRDRTPTPRERYLAAVIRVSADKKLRRRTPAWIVQLVKDGEARFGRR